MPPAVLVGFARQPDHELARSALGPKARALALRGLAQQGDALALDIFDFQARAMGLHIANLAMALDPQFVVIGGGLMDASATSESFRTRYLQIIHETALPYLWPTQQTTLRIVPAVLGDLSQAIGAALIALYRDGGRLTIDSVSVRQRVTPVSGPRSSVHRPLSIGPACSLHSLKFLSSRGSVQITRAVPPRRRPSVRRTAMRD